MALCLVPLAMVGYWAVAGATSMALITLSSIRRSVYIVFQKEMVAERWRVDHEFGADRWPMASVLPESRWAAAG